MIIGVTSNLMILGGYLFLDISLIEGVLSEAVLKQRMADESSL